MSRPEIVAEARNWIGTPYVHQMSVMGAGTDCLGLIRGIWRAVLGAEPELPPAYSRDWSEPSGDEALWRAAQRHLLVCDAGAPDPGDVVLFRMKSGAVAKHLGVIGAAAPIPTFIHAYSGHRVVESPLSRPWQRRIVARFKFPEEMI
ncbi:MAG: NlpC/P60 family protein [Pseudomonadota bacterium]